MHVWSGARDLIKQLLDINRLPAHRVACIASKLSRDSGGFRITSYLDCRSAAAVSEASGRKAAESASRTVSAAAANDKEPANLPLPEKYGFWQAADVLFAKREAPTLVGRWDWHAWQLFVALLPPLAAFGIAKYGQWEMDQAEEQHQREVREAAAAAAGTKSEAAPTAAEPPAVLVQRLDAVEATLRALQAQLEAKAPAGAMAAREVAEQKVSDSSSSSGVGSSGAASRLLAAGGAASTDAKQQRQQQR